MRKWLNPSRMYFTEGKENMRWHLVRFIYSNKTQSSDIDHSETQWPAYALLSIELYGTEVIW